MFEIVRVQDVEQSAKEFGGLIANGSEARYYQISKTEGIKYFTSLIRSVDRYVTAHDVPSLLASGNWKLVAKQFEHMKILAQYKRAPMPLKLLIMESHGALYPAILMEHVDYDNWVFSKDDAHYRRMNRAFDRISRFISARWGISDLHSENVVYDRRDKRFKVIDFGFQDVDLTNPERAHGQSKYYESCKQYWSADLEKRRRYRESLQEQNSTVTVIRRFDWEPVNVELVFAGVPAQEQVPSEPLARLRYEKRQFNEFICKKMKVNRRFANSCKKFKRAG